MIARYKVTSTFTIAFDNPVDEADVIRWITRQLALKFPVDFNIKVEKLDE